MEIEGSEQLYPFTHQYKFCWNLYVKPKRKKKENSYSISTFLEEKL